MATNYIPHPSDQIENIKGLIEYMRLAIGGLKELNTRPTEKETLGMYLTLDSIIDRLDFIDEHLAKTSTPENSAAT